MKKKKFLLELIRNKKKAVILSITLLWLRLLGLGIPSKSESVGVTTIHILELSGGELGKGSSPGEKAHSDARKSTFNSRPKAAKSKPFIIA